MSCAPFPRVAVIGLGLIGGSLATALLKRGLADSVVGFDQNGESQRLGLQNGIISEASDSISAAVQEADLVIVAVPVLAVESVLGEIPDTVLITDVGSVKAPIIDISRKIYGHIPGGLVPGHPIAGSEKHGVTAADPGLFEDHKVILTPVDETDSSAVERIRHLWQGVGATVVLMTAEHHDEVLAQTSHLPHLLAYALVDTLSSQGNSMEIFQFAAGGFRDFTRIAASDPTMWRDIFQANSPAVLEILDRYLNELVELRALIAAGDAGSLQVVFQRAKQARDSFATLASKGSPAEKISAN